MVYWPIDIAAQIGIIPTTSACARRWIDRSRSSISTAKYGRSFLYTETDDNDLTYFLVAPMEVVRRAIDELHAYLERKRTETQEVEMRIRTLDLFNHRQVALIRHALRHPEQSYTFVSHQTSDNVVYQTARTDLLDLWERGILERIKRGRQIVFRVPVDLLARLKRHGKPRGGS